MTERASNDSVDGYVNPLAQQVWRTDKKLSPIDRIVAVFGWIQP